ncbi:MAG: hypothetical protein CSA62_02580 [Planctomycetota bacterium]|nr:MAG: hypothetical protein CSA62_02580 [Planctomycetota bacterium]
MRASYSAELRRQLQGFEPADNPHAKSSLKKTLALLEGKEDPLLRSSFHPGHLTGSAILLSPDQRCLALIWHKKLHRWLQPGGHVEASDSSPLCTARREAVEECGVELDPAFEPVLIQVDVHKIPARRSEPEHDHHDLVFLLRAKSDELHPSEEVGRALWCPLDAPEPYQPDQALAEGIRRARHWQGRSEPEESLASERPYSPRPAT